jgi:hypothetical protein
MTLQARALVASLLNGDLDQREHTLQAHTMRVPSPVLPLRVTPVTSVTTITINGSTVDAGDYSFTPFALVREDGDWPVGRALVTYTTGWVEGLEPIAVQEAITLAAAWLAANPGSGVTQYREGAEAATVDSQAGLGSIRALLNPWVRP